MHFLDDPLRPISQQLWADAVYVRDLWELQSHSRPELLRTALILHEVYHSYDVVHHVLQKLEPNRNILRRFQQLEEVTAVVGRSHMKTKRLDDLLPELGNRVDFLKLDVQGY